MKKWIAALLCAFLLLSLIGCTVSSKQTEAPKTETQASETKEEAKEEEAKEEEAKEEEAKEEEAKEEEAKEEETKEEETKKEETKEEETKEEETKETVPQTTETPKAGNAAESETERVIGDTFRFTIPDGWVKDDRSFISADGMTYISIFGVPVEYGTVRLSEGVTLEDADFPEKWVDYLNELGFYDVEMELYTSDSSYAMEKQIGKTDNGLIYRRMLSHWKDKDTGNIMSAGCILEIYEWDDEKYLMLEYDFDLISSYALDCASAVQKTLERID